MKEKSLGLVETGSNNILTRSGAVEKEPMMDSQGFKQLSSVLATQESGSSSLINSQVARLLSEWLVANA